MSIVVVFEESTGVQTENRPTHNHQLIFPILLLLPTIVLLERRALGIFQALIELSCVPCLELSQHAHNARYTTCTRVLDMSNQLMCSNIAFTDVDSESM